MKPSSAIPLLPLMVVFVLANCGDKGDKVFGVIELVNQITADESSWTGREVTVSGHVSVTSNSNTTDAFVDLRNDRSTPVESHVICKIASGNLPEDVSDKTIVVKGKVGQVYRQNYLNLRNVTLDACEIKNR